MRNSIEGDTWQEYRLTFSLGHSFSRVISIMMLKISLSKLAASTVGFICLFTYPISAQITPDNSLGSESSIVTPNVSVQNQIADLVEGGAVRGNNLFHSFSEFNVDNGSNVYFANPDGIANILTRVTGSNSSEIFGTLGVNGAANLFLLNPNGIVFGQNATLDVNGSFFATTADSYIFENGFEYSASNFKIPPLLTINLPLGVQMGNDPGKMQINGVGHNIVRASDLEPFVNFDNNQALRLNPNRNLTLVAKEIGLDGGNLIAPDGQIQLGSVAEGKVKLNSLDTNSWSLDYSEVKQFQDINLSNKALIDISGTNSGAIQIRGANVNLQDASVIVANHSQSETENAIAIEAEELIEIKGIDQDILVRTGIISNYLGFGKGVSVDLKSKNLLVTEGGFIGATAFSPLNLGEGGDIKLDIADSLIVDGSNPFPSILTSGIVTINLGDGKTGKLILDANRIEVLAGGNVTSSVVGTGRGGDIIANAAESITIKSIDENSSNQSLISSVSFNQGNAGDLTINTAQLQIQDGGRIDSTTFASGNAGNLRLNASESVELTGTSLNSLIPSSINSAAIVNPVPIIRQGFGLPDLPSGDAGRVTITTPQLEVTDSAVITVENSGLGDAGSLDIDADSIVLETGGQIAASTQSGNGGNIHLDATDLLILSDHASISAETQGVGNGGNINLNTDAIALLDGSSIIANAIQGNGGNIIITTQGLFVSPDSFISASSEFGLDGNVEIDEINGEHQFELNRLPENVTDLTNLITVTCSADENNAFAAIGNGGIPKSPYQTQSLNTTWNDLRPVKQETDRVASLPKPLTEATTMMINANGELELVALTPLSTYRWIRSSCSS